ncbi:Ubiquitin-like protein ATG12 [Cyphellophora attinorum]|uniref:Ubiquitin-like protein ATG12 n=1 Tax=Cyphellophora attinorum TaxID=1664694 RepID=A0A0N1H4E3_9EURO|nr:Ubiquitin-like protein ATG12 [Phialophora attinorum]KPI40193.1 Ubiquitin-like protein ATG12 [Phialophora attinorum]
MSSDRPNPRRSSRDIDINKLSESQLLTRPPRPSQSQPSSTPLPTHHRRPSSTLVPQPPPQQERTPSPAPPSPDNPTTSDLPLSLSASTLLHSPALPTDARTALNQIASTLDPPSHKITVRFHAIGDAPPLKQKVAKVSASNTFATIVKFLRKRLYPEGGGEGREADGLFCYVNSVFAPGLDEGVGNLWRCFKVDDQLIVAYSRTPAFG